MLFIKIKSQSDGGNNNNEIILVVIFVLIYFCTVNILNIIIHIFGWRHYLPFLPGERHSC